MSVLRDLVEQQKMLMKDADSAHVSMLNELRESSEQKQQDLEAKHLEIVGVVDQLRQQLVEREDLLLSKEREYTSTVA
eukprot:scaffold5642_cov199-Ochromonas_danica.AAC.1